MTLRKVVLGEMARLAVLVAAFVVYALYAEKSAAINRRLPVNDYCRGKRRNELVCNNELKYQNFTVIYYDGLGKRFYDRFMANSKHGNNSVAYQIVHEGLSDSVPAFYTYFSGKLAFNYGVDLKKEDGFFRQLKDAGLGVATFMNEQMAGLFDDDYQKANTIEKRGLAYSLSPFFLDWSNLYVYNPSVQSQRVIDNIITDRDEANAFFDSEFARFAAMIAGRKDELFSSLDAYFKARPRSFVYIPDVDDFSHNVTIQNRNYISSLAALFNNLEALMEYLALRYPETLLVTMSDHGGDESTCQQERYNHETPFNREGNNPYISFFSPSLERSDFEADVKVKATEVSSILSTMVKEASLSNGFDLSYDFFRNRLMRLTYYRAFELKLLKYSKELLKAEIKDPGHFKRLSKMLRNMGRQTDKFSTEISRYAMHLRSLSSSIKAEVDQKFKSQLNWMSTGIAVLAIVAYCMTALKDVINIDSLNQHVEHYHFATMALFFIVAGDFKETVFKCFIYISLLLMWVKDRRDRFSLPQRSFLVAALGVAVLHLVALRFEWFFYNTKNGVALVVTNLLMLFNLYSTINMIKSQKTIGSVLSGLCLVLMAAANAAYDLLSLSQKAYENSQLIDISRHVFVGSLVSNLVLCLVVQTPVKPECMVETACQFVAYVGNPYERFIVFVILLPQYRRIKAAYGKLNDHQRFKVSYAYVLLGFLVYLASGYYFDWRNRRRLYFKFDMIGFYKPAFLILCVTMAASLEWTKSVAGADFMKPYKFVAGCLLGVVLFNLRHEYRTATGKLLEFIGFTTFVYFYLVVARLVECIRSKETGHKDEGIEFQRINNTPVPRVL